MSEINLGLEIGIVKQALSVTNEAGDKVSMTVSIDFSTTSNADIMSWLASNRIIAGQRPWRKLSKDELEGLDGKVFVAQSIGMKVKSRKEQIQALVGAGLPENLATFAVDNPAEFSQVTKELDAGLVGDSDDV